MLEGFQGGHQFGAYDAERCSSLGWVLVVEISWRMDCAESGFSRGSYGLFCGLRESLFYGFRVQNKTCSKIKSLFYGFPMRKYSLFEK